MGINANTQITGVIGYPVRHTLSPAMLNAAFHALDLNWVYLPFEVSPQRVQEAVGGLRGLGLRGLNVTIPHKESVIPFLNGLTDTARRIAAVNTLFWEGDRLIGDNTDASGFLRALLSAGFDPKGKQALVVGAGGAARAVLYALHQQGTGVFLTNRSPERARQLAEEFHVVHLYPLEREILRSLMKQVDLVVQCTPVGMEPNEEEEPPIPLEDLPAHALVNDLVYRPVQTRLLLHAQSLGLQTLNGLEMLLYQGAEAFSRWTGLDAPLEVMRHALLTALNQGVESG